MPQNLRRPKRRDEGSDGRSPPSARSEKRFPNLFIAGAAKSGTTSLHSYLGQHDDIIMASVKEPNYFNDDLTFKTPQPDEDAYRSLFKDWTTETWAGEASVWYLYSNRAAARIAEKSPNARIIIMLRNPVDMAYAHHSQLLANGNENIVEFREAFNASDSRKAGENLPDRYYILETLFYPDVIELTPQVERFLTAFGRDRVHVVLFDDLATDAGAVVAGCHKFLGVASTSVDLATLKKNVVVRNHRMNRLLRSATVARQLRKWSGSADRYERVHSKISGIRRRLLTTNAPRPPLDPSFRLELTEHVVPDLVRLGGLIERDLSGWMKVSRKS